MEKNYILSEQEHLQLIKDVFGSSDYKSLRPKCMCNGEYAIGRRAWFIRDYIRFRDYDVQIFIDNVEFGRYNTGTLKLMQQEQQKFYGQKEQELREALRTYKAQKFGEAYIYDCTRYVEKKKSLIAIIQANKKRISQLLTEIKTCKANIKATNDELAELERE